MFSDIRVLYEDSFFIVVDKPPGISIHEAPGPGENLLGKLRRLSGIADLTPIHRLDKDASGVLLLARTREAAAAAHRVWDKAEKSYIVVCDGAPPDRRGSIRAPILEHHTSRPERMESALKYFRKAHPGMDIPPPPRPKTSAVHPAGRPSETEYETIETFPPLPEDTGSLPRAEARWSLVEAKPKQGRMHQVRVHLAFMGCPLAVDPLYGRRGVLLEKDVLPGGGEGEIFDRIPLHARRLVLPHPIKAGQRIETESPLPSDMERLILTIRAAARLP